MIHLPVVTISVPMQKAIADPWMAIAKKSFHTPESDSSRPENKDEKAFIFKMFSLMATNDMKEIFIKHAVHVSVCKGRGLP